MLNGVRPLGSSGGPKDEATFVREIKLAALEQKVPIIFIHSRAYIYSAAPDSLLSARNS
jgi:hypothetical protein